MIRIRILLMIKHWTSLGTLRAQEGIHDENKGVIMNDKTLYLSRYTEGTWFF